MDCRGQTHSLRKEAALWSACTVQHWTKCTLFRSVLGLNRINQNVKFLVATLGNEHFFSHHCLQDRRSADVQNPPSGCRAGTDTSCHWFTLCPPPKSHFLSLSHDPSRSFHPNWCQQRMNEECSSCCCRDLLACDNNFVQEMAPVDWCPCPDPPYWTPAPSVHH